MCGGSGAASGWAAEAVAVAHAQLEFSRWGWLFATSAVDYGSIDAQVEAVDGGLMSGRRVGLVIKSGGAWFSDPVPEGWLYRGRNAELLYWMGHSLPIVLLFYNPDTAITYWVHVTQDNAQIDRTGWKILIPSSQVLDPQALPAFWALADPAGWAGPELAILRLRARLTRQWPRPHARQGMWVTAGRSMGLR